MQFLQRIIKYDKAVFAGLVILFLIGIWYAQVQSIAAIYVIPFALIGVVIAAENFRLIWYGALFLMPLSVNVNTLIQDSSVQFPTDLLSFALMGILLFKMISEKNNFSAYYRHPVTVNILMVLCWQMVCLFTVEDLSTSGKYVLMTAWFVFAFYLVSTIMFSNPKAIVYFYFLTGSGFVLSMLIILGKYFLEGRNPFSLRFNPMPVFRDHTLFGAFTTFFIPMFFLFAWRGNFSRTLRLSAFVIFIFFAGGLFFSYSRGAWASTFVAMLLMGLFMFRQTFRRFAVPVMILVLAGVIFVYNSYRENNLRNEAVSRESFVDHVMSMTNFKSDDSNVERLNRWASAIEMYRERPVFGFGPGSYSFEYGNYQFAKNRTKISTNHGDNGTAHNEMMLALSETGLPGAILTFALLLLPIILGIRGYLRASEKNIRLIYLGATTGLASYFLHSMVNNFLDQDKVAVAFFASLAILTALDLRADRQPATNA